jgi:hypothetical protein
MIRTKTLTGKRRGANKIEITQTYACTGHLKSPGHFRQHWILRNNAWIQRQIISLYQDTEIILLRHVQLAQGVQVFLRIVSLAISQGRTAGTTAQSILSQAFAWPVFSVLSLHETGDI